MYIPQYFTHYEWIDKKTNIYLQGDPYKIWRLFDDRVLRTADILRNLYGPIIMNDYHHGGTNQFRGFRPFDCEIGAKWSDHKFGRAGDLVFKFTTAEQVRQDVLDNPGDQSFKHITAIEMGVDWFHFATRNWTKETKGVLKIEPN